MTQPYFTLFWTFSKILLDIVYEESDYIIDFTTTLELSG